MDAQVPFHELYAAYYPKMVRYLSNLGDVNDAEDLAQTVFVKAHGAFGNFRSEASVSTWLYRIATNVATDKARNPSFKETPHSYDDLLKLPGAEDTNLWTGENASSIDQELVRREMTDCIRSIVDKLPQASRAVILLSEFEGLKNWEIAEVLDVSLETVKIRLVRARLKLRQEMGKQCTFYRDERNELACHKKECC